MLSNTKLPIETSKSAVLLALHIPALQTFRVASRSIQFMLKSPTYPESGECISKSIINSELVTLTPNFVSKD